MNASGAVGSRRSVERWDVPGAEWPSDDCRVTVLAAHEIAEPTFATDRGAPV